MYLVLLQCQFNIFWSFATAVRSSSPEQKFIHPFSVAFFISLLYLFLALLHSSSFLGVSLLSYRLLVFLALVLRMLRLCSHQGGLSALIFVISLQLSWKDSIIADCRLLTSVSRSTPSGCVCNLVSSLSSNRLQLVFFTFLCYRCGGYLS